MTLYRSYVPILALLFTVMLMAFGGEVKGQCGAKTRTYANFQGSLEKGTGALFLPVLVGSVQNGPLAIDGNFNTNSILSVPLGALNLASATQYLEFTSDGTHANKRTIAANTEVTVKFTLPKELIGLASGLSIGTFENLKPETISWPSLLGNGQNAGYSGIGEVEYFTSTSLLNLLNGTGELEISFKPTADFSGIYLKLSSVLSLGLSAKLFHAYIMEDNASDIYCDAPIDVLSGVKATAGLGLANITGSVTNPQNSIDVETTTPTFTFMDAGAQVLSKTFETIIFNKPSVPGDSISLVLKGGNSGLIDLDLLGTFTIQPYLKDATAGPAFLSNSNFLKLRLLPGPSELSVVTMPVTSSFDRVEISMMGVANLLSKLSIYDVKRIIPKPIIQSTGLTNKNLSVCFGQTPVLTISNSQTSSCITYTWYKDGIEQSPKGASYQLPSSLPPGIYTYKVIAKRSGCLESAESETIIVTVNPLPSTFVNIGPSTLCVGAGQTFKNANPIIGVWSSDNPGVATVDPSSGLVIALAVGSTKITYTVTNTLTHCSNFSSTIVSVYAPPSINLGTIASVCAGTTSSLLSYTSASGGILKYDINWNTSDLPNVTGADLPSDPITLTIPANIIPNTYYGSFIIRNTTGVCPSTYPISITINPLPTITLGQNPYVCQGIINAPLTYTLTTENPTTYSITWDAAATDEGFSVVTNNNLTSSPISITVPSLVASGIYKGSITVKNGNCESLPVEFNFIVHPKPPTPLVNVNSN